MAKTFKQFMKESKRAYGGGSDNAGGHSYYTHASDGSSISVYVPGKHTGGSSSYGHTPPKPEPKHPLHGHKVTDGKVVGRLIGTEHQGSVAKIKHPTTGAIHYVDAKDIKKA